MINKSKEINWNINKYLFFILFYKFFKLYLSFIFNADL